jgi:AmiR/NasT family two-component response regulator
MSDRANEHLRVLIANERGDRLTLVRPIFAALGHEVIVEETGNGASLNGGARADIALVAPGDSPAKALVLIERLVERGACPVIVLTQQPDPAFVKEAAERGAYGHLTDADPAGWQSAIEIVLRRFNEYRALEGAFDKRAITERAKGILMERHSIDEAAAFWMLREHARNSNRKLVDIAAAVVDGHRLLPGQSGGGSPRWGSSQRRVRSTTGDGDRA